MLKIFNRPAKIKISDKDLQVLLLIAKKDNKSLNLVLSDAVKHYSLHHFYDDIVKNGL